MASKTLVRLLLFSDLHLDTAFPWAGAEAGSRRRLDQAECLDAIVALAVEQRADALVSAGDLYDASTAGPQTAERLREAFARLGQIPVILLPGESDPLSAESL